MKYCYLWPPNFVYMRDGQLKSSNKIIFLNFIHEINKRTILSIISGFARVARPIDGFRNSYRSNGTGCSDSSKGTGFRKQFSQSWLSWQF